MQPLLSRILRLKVLARTASYKFDRPHLLIPRTWCFSNIRFQTRDLGCEHILAHCYLLYHRHFAPSHLGQLRAGLDHINVSATVKLWYAHLAFASWLPASIYCDPVPPMFDEHRLLPRCPISSLIFLKDRSVTSGGIVGICMYDVARESENLEKAYIK